MGISESLLCPVVELWRPSFACAPVSAPAAADPWAVGSCRSMLLLARYLEGVAHPVPKNVT